MKIKLDENIGARGRKMLIAAGHDVATVAEQGMQGTLDCALFEVCSAAGRVLVTLDRGFGEVLRFSEMPGSVVVLDLGPRPTLQIIETRIANFVRYAAVQSIEDEIWVVEAGRVRVRNRAATSPS